MSEKLKYKYEGKSQTGFRLTRLIKLVIGGKQGSMVTGRMFTKMMDKLPEKLINDRIGFAVSPTFQISAWVDNLVSSVEGDENQKEVMEEVDEFGVKQKLVGRN